MRPEHPQTGIADRSTRVDIVVAGIGRSYAVDFIKEYNILINCVSCSLFMLYLGRNLLELTLASSIFILSNEQKVVFAALIASAAAFAPAPAFRATTAIFEEVDPNPAPTTDAEALEMGWSMGGQAHTKDPTPQVNDDPRKTIPQGESFEEYMKSRAAN
jgi:hypothetical protein